MTSTPAIYVVLQKGGSSSEFYFHSFESEVLATQFVQSSEAASYTCLGPERLELPEVGHLMSASRHLIAELRDQGETKLEGTQSLEAALSVLETRFGCLD